MNSKETIIGCDEIGSGCQESGVGEGIGSQEIGTGAGEEYEGF